MFFSFRLITSTFRAHQRISVGMTPEDFAALTVDADIWEQDRHGPKVYHLASGNILKIFRRKHVLSSAALTSYARHFCHNAESLKWLAIPTVDIVDLFHLTCSRNTAVIYMPLPGRTVRQIAQEKALSAAFMHKLGSFIAHLHDKGIYFRSLHFGNVVLTAGNEFGLIDIADMKCYSRPLPSRLRIRNFRHFLRLADDWKNVSAEAKRAVAAGYLETARLSQRAKKSMCKEVSVFGDAA